MYLIRRLDCQLKTQRVAKEQSLRIQLQQAVKEPKTLFVILASVQSLNDGPIGRGDGIGAHLQLVQQGTSGLELLIRQQAPTIDTPYSPPPPTVVTARIPDLGRYIVLPFADNGGE